MEPSHSPFGMRDYLGVLRRRTSVVVLAVMVVAGVALASVLLQIPVYRSTASVLLKPVGITSVLNPAGGAASDPARDLQTQLQVVTSQPVKAAVRAELGIAPDVVVAPHGQANVIDVSARSTDPASSAIAANTYANAYITYRRSQDLNDALAAESQIQTRVADLQHQIDTLNGQIKGAPASLAASLTAQTDSLVQQQGTLKQQLGQLQIQAALVSGGAQVVSPAATPGAPVSPRPARDVVLAIITGLMLGIGAAFGLEYFDDSFKSREDVVRVLPDAPVLAIVPRVTTWKDREDPVIISVSEPTSPAAEAFRALRTSLQFIALDQPLRSLQITSPSAGEGKTAVLSNLGVALAQVGQRVIICCCDLRRPRLHEFFGLNNSDGFTSVVVGELPVSSALQAVEGLPNLRIMASGPLPPNPSELLSSNRAAEVLTSLQSEADILLIDCPPLLPVTDAAVLSRVTDATLLVVTAGSTTRKQAAQAMITLQQVDAPVIGTVLNGVATEWSGYTYQLDRYGQGRPKRETNRRSRRLSDQNGRDPTRIGA